MKSWQDQPQGPRLGRKLEATCVSSLRKGVPENFSLRTLPTQLYRLLMCLNAFLYCLLNSPCLELQYSEAPLSSPWDPSMPEEPRDSCLPLLPGGSPAGTGPGHACCQVFQPGHPVSRDGLVQVPEVLTVGTL